MAAAILVASALGLGAQLAPIARPISPAAANSSAPKAVFIVGPTGSLTDSNLVAAEKMAKQAEVLGMDVRRVFFPNATWENVLSNIQGARLVVYMGHGYGWPSRYTSVMTESRQNGMGLNSFRGSGRNDYKYYGATVIRENVALSPNAVVILVHLCYAAGNGEPGMANPSADVARQRVDNFAGGFLAAGARAVFAFGWDQEVNFPRQLAMSEATMDELFMMEAGGSPAGFVGWRNERYASARTPGAVNHLDPHSKHGYYRALTGDLDMSAADWRSGWIPEPPPPEDPPDPPRITYLKAVEASGGTVSFHPNGDGLDDELRVRHTVTRAAYLDVTVANNAGETVRSYSVWAPKGTKTSDWNGKDGGGFVVPDGVYTLTYVPRNTSGVVGAPVSISALVLTAAALAPPSKASIHVSDADSVGSYTSLKVTLNQPARLTWRLLNEAGATVRTISSDAQTPAGTISFDWDGKSGNGTWVPDGHYRSVVRAQTGLGSYSQERQVFVGAFQVTTSITSPARGEKVTLTVVSTESLDRNPTVLISQPGVDPWTVTAKPVNGKKYKVTVTLKSGGTDGRVDFLISGTDTKGGSQSSSVSLPLR